MVKVFQPSFSLISKIVAYLLSNFLLKHPKLMDLSPSSVLLDKSTIMPSESRVYGHVAQTSFCLKSELYRPKCLVKLPKILTLMARNFIMLNNILASLLPFTVLVLSHRRLKNEIYYSFIALVSCYSGVKE